LAQLLKKSLTHFNTKSDSKKSQPEADPLPPAGGSRKKQRETKANLSVKL